MISWTSPRVREDPGLVAAHCEGLLLALAKIVIAGEFNGRGRFRLAADLHGVDDLLPLREHVFVAADVGEEEDRDVVIVVDLGATGKDDEFRSRFRVNDGVELAN